MTTTPGSRTLREGQTSAPAAAPSPESADAPIIDALSRGETRRALGLCVERHGASIGRSCMAMLGSQQDADAVTEETLFLAHQRFGELRAQTSVRAWLFGIAREQCLQHLEKKRRRGSRTSSWIEGRRGSRVSPAGLARETDGRALVVDPGLTSRATKVRALLDQVRPSDRDALLLRFLADLSFHEVAAACGIDQPTARRRASQALLRLRSLLESEHDDE